jgi:hypothetical protein
MGDELCVEVSGDLAEILTGAGFDEVVSFRGFETDSYTVLTVIPATIAVAANLATILVSREAVGDLIDGIRSWMGSPCQIRRGQRVRGGGVSPQGQHENPTADHVAV